MTKRLFKSRSNRMFCGVCGGIAEYFSIDVALVRLGAMLLSFCSAGVGFLVAYFICAAIIPNA